MLQYEPQVAASGLSVDRRQRVGGLERLVRTVNLTFSKRETDNTILSPSASKTDHVMILAVSITAGALILITLAAWLITKHLRRRNRAAQSPPSMMESNAFPSSTTVIYSTLPSSSTLALPPKSHTVPSIKSTHDVERGKRPRFNVLAHPDIFGHVRGEDDDELEMKRGIDSAIDDSFKDARRIPVETGSSTARHVG